MKLFIKQKIFSWRDKFFIYDEKGNKIYYVLGEAISLGKKLDLRDMNGNKLSDINQKLISLRPKYYINQKGKETIEIYKKISLLVDKYQVTKLDWVISGDIFKHEYKIENGKKDIAKITKKWLSWADTYQVEIEDNIDVITVISLVIAIDAMLQAAKEDQEKAKNQEK